jgi:hypothetical protein
MNHQRYSGLFIQGRLRVKEPRTSGPLQQEQVSHDLNVSAEGEG